MGDAEKPKTDTQRTVLRMAGKKVMAALGKKDASDAEVESFAKALDEFEQARSFFRHGF